MKTNRAITLLALSALWTATAGEAIASGPRQAFFGDLHLHTSYSLDSYLGGATRVDPDTAYRFARGDVVHFHGQPMQRTPPLDFLAVTDHSENLGAVNALDDPDSALSRSTAGKTLRRILNLMSSPDGRLDIERLAPHPQELATLYALSQDYAWGLHNRAPAGTLPPPDAAWRREVEAANRNYVPDRFTTFIAYEWTAAAHGANLHRNVIFRGDSAPQPFTSWDSRNPEDLWDWLDAQRAQGIEVLAIPHNSNASDGLMFAWLDSSAGYIDARHARQRARNEPLAEITQNKGSSETHPLLSPNDEFADFEILDYYAGDRRAEGRASGSYLRDALGRGLVLEAEIGQNPFRYGFVGASDLHSGLSVSAAADYAGNYYRPNIGAGRPDATEAAEILRVGGERVEDTRATTSGGLTGVWAERNTRESIFDALRRRECFATSGTRLRLRLFGGWKLAQAVSGTSDWIEAAYRHGVPMGAGLAAAPAAGAAPEFVLWATKDPAGTNLERIQIVKVWEDGGQQQERVFDAASAGAQTEGVAEFRTVWRDPQFDAHQRAAYYLRVLEVPTPRWTTLLAHQAGVAPPADVPERVQQRGWSSPIWYAPATRSAGAVSHAR